MENIVQLLEIIASEVIINNQLKLLEDVSKNIITPESEFTQFMNGLISKDINALRSIVNGGSDDV